MNALDQVERGIQLARQRAASGMPMRAIDRVNAAFAETRLGQRSVFTSPLTFNEYSNFFNYAGIAYPIIQTTLGSIDRERVAMSSVGAYKMSGPVASLCFARMQAFAQARFQWTRFNGSQPGPLFGTQALSILEHPWGPSSCTADLLARADLDASLAGNSYTFRVRSDKLSRLRPEFVTIILGSASDADHPQDAPDVEIAAYLYTPPSGEEKIYFPEQVCHYAPLPDPYYHFLGMSWLTPAIREIQGDSLATEHKLRFFENAATPNLAIKFDPSIDIDKVRQFRDLMEDEHQGAFSAWRTLFLGGGADPVTVGLNFQQMDYAVQQGRSESRLASLAGVPPSWVGFMEGLQGSSLNAGNFTAARRRFTDGTLEHLWTNFASSMSALVQDPENAPGADLFLDRNVPVARDDAQDLAAIRFQDAQTMNQLVMAGYDPDSIVAAITTGDWGLLKHTGLTSVQLQPPAQAGQPPALPPGGNPDSNGPTGQGPPGGTTAPPLPPGFTGYPNPDAGNGNGRANPYHVQHGLTTGGQFTSPGGTNAGAAAGAHSSAAVAEPGTAGDYLADLAQAEQNWAAKGEAIWEAHEWPETKTHYADPNGPHGYTAGRAALHDQIIAHFLAGQQRSARPQALFLGGGPASGKSTILQGAPGVQIDADAIKAQLPEYQQMLAAKNPAAAATVHEESSDLAKLIMERAAQGKIDFTLDGTGDSTYAKLAAKVAEARKGGHQVSAKYATIDTEEAVRRSNLRAERSGRKVPESVIRATHSAVSDTFYEAVNHNLFDSVQLWDNSSPDRVPVLVAEKPLGGQWKVLRDDLWQSFLAKGTHGTQPAPTEPPPRVPAAPAADVPRVPDADDPAELDRATALQRLAGLWTRGAANRDADRRWYADAHDEVGRRAAQLGLDPEVFAGMVAATSPQTSWDLPHSPRMPNLEAAETVARLARENADMSPDQLSQIRGVGGILGNNIRAASRIMRGESAADVLGGAKVRSFYSNLVDPDNPVPVTVDTHMIHAMLDRHDKEKATEALAARILSGRTPRGTGRTVGGYSWAADRIRDAAAAAGVPPLEFQAATWTQWRREGGAMTTRKAHRG